MTTESIILYSASKGFFIAVLTVCQALIIGVEQGGRVKVQIVEG